MQRATRTTKAKTTPDDIARQLASALTISNAKGKQKASEAVTVEERRLSAMRAVNDASHNLSSIIQSTSKSKCPEGVPQDSSKRRLNDLAASAARSLRELRALSPGDVDVERAASSVMGKLIALELFDASLLALTEMKPRLCSLYAVQPKTATSKTPNQLHLLTLPLPPSDASIDPIILTLISTYLVHSLTTLCHIIFSSAKPSKDTPSDLANALTNNPTLITWIPFIAPLSAKHKNTVLTRVYTVLTASVSTSSQSGTRPRTAPPFFAIRAYALSCLLHTSLRTVEPDTLWDQATKFAGAFVKSNWSASDRPTEDETTRLVLSTFADLVHVARGNGVGEVFLKGRGFVRFCEYWMGFAKRVGDVCVLDQIAELMKSAALSSSGSSLEHGVEGERMEKEKEKKNLAKKEDASVMDGARICAAFAQATALLEQEFTSSASSDHNNMVKRVNEATAILRTSKLVADGGADPDPDPLRKVRRAMERMRRVAVKVLDTVGKGDDSGRESLKMLLVAVVDVLQRDMVADPDAITSALDTLFVLARTSLNTSNVKTHDISYDFLTQAAKLLEIEGGEEGMTAQQANLTRCVSGAFHHLAGALYQDGRHAPAVRFLKEACILGRTALSVHRGRGGVSERENVEEAWKLLEDQLYRRWELLGVCYSKLGERKLGYESFVQSVRAFPYSGTGLLQHGATAGLEAAFSASSDLKQLGTIINRLTYLGTCELLLAPTEVSLKHLVHLAEPGITGVLVEQQLECLEGIIWKEGVREVFAGLLADALGAYTGDAMPVRRARVLLRCLDFSYHVGPERVVGVAAGLESPLEMGLEAVKLFKRNTFRQDAGLAQFSTQYRASAHLWLALHAHRRADPEQITLVAHHVEEACQALKSLGASTSEPTGKSKSSQRQTTIAKTGTGRAPARRVAAPKRATRNVNKEPVTPLPRKALETMSTNVTPPRPTAGGKTSTVLFDQFDKLRSLLQMVSSLLGLLGLVLPKINVLDVARRLCERQGDRFNDGYIVASVDLAHECLKLGKTKRASAIYGQALNAVGSGRISDEVCTRFFLRYAESLASVDNVLRSSSVYCEALGLSNTLPDEEKGMSTSQRIRARAARLERAAMASHVFAMIQYSKEDITTSLDAMLQSLRLWNRAVDTLSRLAPPPPSSKPAPDSDPFAMPDMADALPSNGPDSARTEQPVPKKTYTRRPALDGLEWRIAEGLLGTLFSICQAYFTRGSSREAEYFAQQAHDLAESLNAPAMASRALAKKGEVQLHQGLLEEGYESLVRAAEVLRGTPGTDAVEIHRLRGDYNQRTARKEDAWQLYQEADAILEKLNQAFGTVDGPVTSPRKSAGLSPMGGSAKETLVPSLLAAVLRQQIWLLRDDVGGNSKALLNRFLTLPPSFQTKVEENALMAKLTLHKVHERFHADIFLSSLAESTIALPMGMSGDGVSSMSHVTQDILATLDNAEKLFWAGLALISRRGGVAHVRDAAISLALIRALQTSLGKAGNDGPRLTACLLDASSAITLRREMLETIQHKFPDFQTFDDLQWPLITPNGSPLPRPKNRTHARFDTSTDSEDEEDSPRGMKSLKQYWDAIRSNYQARTLNPTTLSLAQVNKLPANWTVVNISITEDKSTMFVSRQRANTEPLVFCVPLKGRRESEEDEYLTFDDAMNELRDIIKMSDEGTRRAIHVKNDDQQARASWWAERSALDKRMQSLLENIEFCWLGAFKTILSQPMKMPQNVINSLRAQLDKVFQNSLQPQEKKQKTRIRLDDTLLECFSTLSPKCRDEELEDLIYFILDLYQFHGVPVAIAEVDVVQVMVDLRVALQEYAVKTEGQVVPVEDSHTFLVLDKNVQGIPWESIPILRGRSVSRIPSMDFLVDRLQFAGWQKRGVAAEAVVDRAVVDPRKTYYVLNPSGDLGKTEGRFASWVKDMKKVGWKGVVGRPPSEQEFLNALSREDLVIYFGHGGGEQYVRSHKIRHLPRCAATMLWGCSSGSLRDMGDFDRVGTPYNYMLAGCPTLVANLWDVTDRDIDKYSQSVFDKMRMTVGDVGRWHGELGKVSLITAVAGSRDSCKLKYLTGAAPVVYGIPFYL